MRRTVYISAASALVLCLAACSGEGTGSFSGGPDASPDTGSDALDDVGDDSDRVDAADTGIYGRSCSVNADCDGGVCVDLGGATTECSTICDSNSQCPVGWDCTGDEGAIGGLRVCASDGLCIDEDGDGFGVGGACDGMDCDDTDPDINPLASEICDGVDENCNGTIDEFALDSNAACELNDGPCGAGRTVCRDGGELACVAIYNPASEVCDEIDNDCDGTNDEQSVDEADWYPDSDGDGYGDENADPVVTCGPVDGMVTNNQDCDDDNPDVNAGAPEPRCDDVRDFNCDGFAGSGDNDGDGFAACEECDDGDPNANPDATDVCDGRDNDCDGEIDEISGFEAESTLGTCDTGEIGVCAVGNNLCISGEIRCVRAAPPQAELCDTLDNDCDGIEDEDVIDAQSFYADDDEDGYGDATTTTTGCAPPPGFVTNDGDCDDSESLVNANASEICDGLDGDCDGEIDEDAPDGDECDTGQLGICAEGLTNCSGDARGFACEPRNQAGTELCNGLDDDCDGTLDEDLLTETSTYYRDADGDGYGSLSESIEVCSPPDGYVVSNDDCDDTDVSSHPNAREICDLADNDCDGTVDESLRSGPCFTGQVGVCADGYSNCVGGAITCDPVVVASTEVCDGQDNDCDGDTDEDFVGQTTYYADRDDDGYGDARSAVSACAPGGVYTATQDGDCYDNNSAARPGGTGYYGVDRGDGSYDYNCDGQSTPRYATVGTCGADCRQNGYWDDRVPACGSAGSRLICDPFIIEDPERKRLPPPDQCSPQLTMQTQTCR